MMTIPKSYRKELTIRNENFLVRDHQIFGVRVLPGVALLEIIYRMAYEAMGSLGFTLLNITFSQPIATSTTCDRKVRVSMTHADDERWNVTVESRRVGGLMDAENEWSEHVSCILRLCAAADVETLPSFDFDSFLQGNRAVLDMDDLYGAVARPVGIEHKGLMKAEGKIYHRDREEVMALSLNDFAESYRSRFLAHPALLDSATMGGASISRFEGGRLKPLEFTYVPIGFREFRLYQPFGRNIYVVSKPEAESAAVQEAREIISQSMRLYDLQGHLVGHYDRMLAKRIHASSMIERLTANVASDNGVNGRIMSDTRPRNGERNELVVDSVVPPPASRSQDPTTRDRIENYLVNRISALLGGADVGSQRDVQFYNLGMGSNDLFDLTHQLEAVCGHELHPSLLFEHQTIAELAEYLQTNDAEKFTNV